jgi:hypothetical protein
MFVLISTYFCKLKISLPRTDSAELFVITSVKVALP